MRRLVWIGFGLLSGLCLLLIFSPQVRLGFVSLVVPGGNSEGVPLVAARERSDQVPTRARVAVAAMVSPARTFLHYRSLFEYLARKVGVAIEFVQRKTYREINELVSSGQLDLAWICTGAWPELSRQGVASLLVAPQVNGRAKYRSYLVVRASSPYRSLEDLQGSRIAFSDPLSLTGCRLPQLMIRQMGTSPEAFFSGSFYTFSHDNSLSAVARGLADVAGVDSLVYDFLVKASPKEIKDLRILATSEDLPTPPVVVGRMDEKWKALWREAFLGAHKDPEGKALLGNLNIDSFVAVAPSDYANLP